MVEGSAGLSWCDDVGDSPSRYAAFAALVASVFDMELEPPDRVVPSMWSTLACFDDSGRCVAGAEFGCLSLVLDGMAHATGCIRLVGVAEDWRGRGLFRTLMERALRWSADHRLDLTLLYAAEPALYHRFGFAGVAQHAFVGPAPAPAASAPARPLDPVRERALVQRLLAARTPVSRHVAVAGAPDLFLHRLTGDDDLSLVHLPDDDALVAFEAAGDTLLLVDVVAARVPPLSRILGALPQRFAQVKALFPPDRLEWQGAAMAEETGLMARGTLPPAMRRPFMLPPTTEF